MQTFQRHLVTTLFYQKAINTCKLLVITYKKENNMALISPGTEVTIIDESQYTPTALGTIAYILIATAQDKINPSGTVATGTTVANSGEIIPVSSQRELVDLFGTPNFTVDANDNPVNADEQNEYGLLAAYSALGVASRVYIQRADVNLDELAGSAIRPTGTPVDNTYWLDLDTTAYGIFQWDGASSFVAWENPGVSNTSGILAITDASQVSGSVPLVSVGQIGDYAVNTLNVNNPIYFKKYDNTWALVGTAAWQEAWPSVTGLIANPADLAQNDMIVINGGNVTISNATPTVTHVAADINLAAITGVTASVSASGQLEIRVDETSYSTGNAQVVDGAVGLAAGTPDALAKVGITVGTYYAPTVQHTDYRNAPAWRESDTIPRPAGSVWLKTSATGGGANWGLKRYNALLGTWETETAPLYWGDEAAIFGMDPVGGGAGIAINTIYVRWDASDSATLPADMAELQFRPYIKNVASIVKATGTTPTVPIVFVANDVFELDVSVPGSETEAIATVTLSGTTVESLVADILSAAIPNVTAVVETGGALSISHLAGGTIEMTQTTGTPLQDAGIFADANVQEVTTNVKYLLSPFTPLVYTVSDTAPFTNPADNTLWYYNDPLSVDIMVHDGAAWRGYKLVTNDARGYDLSGTDALGPILAALEPTTQVGGSALVPGDLWLDTSELENYPMLYRWTSSSLWELIDNADDESIDGIVFADARWGTNNDTDPIVDDFPDIVSMQSSDYLDDDAPDYRLFPRGSLLFNTRRSGFTVKRFESEWFANATVVPTELASWVSQSGVDSDGVAYFGSKAQRNTVVEAMKASVEGSTPLREEQIQFNLICCPGYSELIQNMVTLNNDRKQTAFIIGDCPLQLNSSTAALETWASNANLANDNGRNGLVSSSEYLGVFYPPGFATNLDGESVVVPPSHMMLRTFIRSDNVSYPWFAPAGVRRGLIDNVSSIGYVDETDDNVFRSIGVTESLRDVLYSQRVNPLTVLPGVGLVAYGQKTRASQTSAMDRINVARLVNYLRVILDKVARPFIFEPNDTITRNQVKAGFEAVLNDIVAKRGIYDYLVVCDTSNNTPDRIDRNELWIDIAIEPVKAIEFIYIPVRLKNTGEIAAGT
jgi:hypothetical protein